MNRRLGCVGPAGRMAALLACFGAVAGFEPVSGLEAGQDSQHRGPVLLPARDGSPSTVPETWRRSVGEALAESAHRHGLALCSTPCADPGAGDVELDWRFEVEVRGSVLVVAVATLALDLRGVEDGVGPDAGLFALRGQYLLPEEATALEREGLLAARFAELVSASPQAAEWLEVTAATPAVAALASRPAPGEAHSPSLESAAAPVASRAEGVPPEGAEALTPLAAPAAPTEAPAIEEPRPATRPPHATIEPPFDMTFRVRMAGEAGGFSRGRAGRLRVFAGGLRFVAEGDPPSRWSIPWSELAAYRRAEGLWDVPHPLVIETTAGQRRFLVEIGSGERFGSGARLLAALSTGEELARRDAAARSHAP